MKTAVVYYSGTGNTEAMANKMAETLREKADVSIITADSFSASDVADYDAFAFGCPAMGAEVLEEETFEPMFTSVEGALSGKKVALFGSYGWGDGEWMRNWEERCRADGMDIVGTVICQDAPDDNALNELEALANSLI